MDEQPQAPPRLEPPPGALGYAPHYAPPGASGVRPVVIMYFRVYAAMVVVLYLVSIAFLGIWQYLTPAHNYDGSSSTSAGDIAIIAIFMVMVVAFAAFYIVAAMVPFKPWGWTVGLVAICLGLTSCTAIFAIPLLIYWLKPETKAAFCRL